MHERSNYLNEDEACAELDLDLACIRRFAKWSWLDVVKTTTGILVLRHSVERLRRERPARLAYAQLHCRKVAEKRRLKASQRTLDV